MNGHDYDKLTKNGTAVTDNETKDIIDPFSVAGQLTQIHDSRVRPADLMEPIKTGDATQLVRDILRTVELNCNTMFHNSCSDTQAAIQYSLEIIERVGREYGIHV